MSMIPSTVTHVSQRQSNVMPVQQVQQEQEQGDGSKGDNRISAPPPSMGITLCTDETFQVTKNLIMSLEGPTSSICTTSGTSECEFRCGCTYIGSSH